MQDPKIAKNSPSGHHRQLCQAMSSQLRHLSTIGKKLLNINTSSTCPHNMANFGPLTAEIGLPVGHPCQFQGVLRLGSVTARHSSSGRQPNFAALNRGRHLYSAGRRSRWALAHILVFFYIFVLFCVSCEFFQCRIATVKCSFSAMNARYEVK